MEESKKISRFQKSWQLTKASWQALKLDKELFALPVVGFGLSLIVLILAGTIAFLNPNNLFYVSRVVKDGAEGQVTGLGYVAVLFVGLMLAVISTFIAGAVTHGALERFKGNDPNIKSSLAAAWQRIGSLTAFAAFSFSVGYVLSEIASRIPFIGAKIVVWLADAAWRVASFFAIPVIMTSDAPVNPLHATKSSIRVIKKVWGESLIISATIGLVALLAFMGYFGLAIALFYAGVTLSVPGVVYILLGTLLLVGVAALALMFNMLEAFIKTAIYYYATTGKAPAQFNQEILRQAFTPKKARKIFASAK